MGPSYPLGRPRFVPEKAKFFGVIFWLYNKSFIDEAYSVKMAGYWPRSFFFFAFLRTETKSGPDKNKKREFGQYPVILTSRLVNNAYIRIY